MADDGFAARLRELREQAGLTQQQLADAAGMHRFGIAKLEQGRREPSWATVRSLCQALGVSCDSFLVEPADRPTQGRVRPRKAVEANRVETEPKKAEGKPTKQKKKTKE